MFLPEKKFRILCCTWFVLLHSLILMGSLFFSSPVFGTWCIGPIWSLRAGRTSTCWATASPVLSRPVTKLSTSRILKIAKLMPVYWKCPILSCPVSWRLPIRTVSPILSILYFPKKDVWKSSRKPEMSFQYYFIKKWVNYDEHNGISLFHQITLAVCNTPSSTPTTLITAPFWLASKCKLP